MAEKRAPEPSPVRVILACEDMAYGESLIGVLSAHGMEVLCSTDVHDRDLIRADVLVVEIQGVGRQKRQLLARIRRLAPLVEVVAISAEPGVPNAVRALRSGVFAVLSYPVSAEHLARTVWSACDRKRRAEARMEQLNGAFHRRPAEARSTPSTEERG